MSDRDAVDREIAERLGAAVSPPVGDALMRRLEEAAGRGRRLRRRRRHVAIVAAVLGIVAVPAATVVGVNAVRGGGSRAVVPADSTRLLGTFTTEVTSARTADTALIGRWTFRLHGDGTIGVKAPSQYRGVVTGSDFIAAGDTVRLNLFVQDRCSSAPVGRYRWTRDDAGLHFALLSDGCAARRIVLTSAVWQPGT